jgi:hypothetical protein|tara:strand:+ start:31 stop:831 length:801 start_codon:yes stop_codon:yes gene_type:complete
MGRSKDLATGETRFVNTAGDTMTGNLLLGSNSIGLGTTSPDEKIHVEGSILVDAFNAGNETGIFFREGFTSSNKYNHSILAYDDDGSPDGISINGYGGVSICTGSNSRQERFKVNNSGAVTKPANPCAVWGHSTNYTLTQDSSWRDVALNTTVYDKANNYSTSTYRFTAPVAGVYLVGFSGEFHSTSNTVWSYLVPRINGSNTANVSNKGNYMADFTTSGTYSVHHQTWFLNLAANDYFVFSHIGSGGNLTLRGVSEAQFFATLLG